MKSSNIETTRDVCSLADGRQKKGKTIPLHAPRYANESREKPKISIQRCREIMCTDGLEYTDEELYEIRDFMYHLASIAFTQIKHDNQQSIIIPLKPHQNNQDEESHYLRTG